MKINANNSESYRAIIKYLNSNKFEFHTYQSQEARVFRVVIINIHPSMPTSENGIALQDMGYGKSQMPYTKPQKNPLPFFFIDPDPTEINKEIFALNHVLHTKIKTEEPHKRHEIIQCFNCQDYGHSKSYCSHPPKCDRCAAAHPTSSCTHFKDHPQPVPYEEATIQQATEAAVQFTITRNSNVNTTEVLIQKKKY